MAQLEADVKTDVMEGGFKMNDFIQKNGPYMQNLMGALDVAMMLETQALDLYGRFAAKAEAAATKEFLTAGGPGREDSPEHAGAVAGRES